MFLKTNIDELLNLAEARRIFEIDNGDGSRTIAVLLHGGETIKLSRHYTLENLSRLLAPEGAGR